jgi:hypothetical protein
MSTLSISKFRAITFATILAVVPLSPASHAQDIEGAVVVNVPFAFQNGSQHLTAGLYTIGIESNNMLVIRGELRSGFALTLLDDDTHPSKTTRVVFRKYGDQYFLHEVWIEGESSHTSLLPSKVEEREIAANRTAPTGVVVAALEMPR